MGSRKLRVLGCGLDSQAIECLNRNVMHLQLVEVKTADEFTKLIEDLHDHSYELILCGNGIGDLPSTELAQALRTQVPSTKLYYLTTQAVPLDFAGLSKNGYDEIFVLPSEECLCAEALRQVEREFTGTAKLVYQSVPVTDFEIGTEISFSVSIHLNQNDKYIKLFKPGAKIEERQIQRFEKYKVAALCVEEGEIEKFIAYSAGRLSKLAKDQFNNYASKLKLQKNVRELFRNITSSGAADFESGKSLLETSKRIIAEFLDNKPAQALHERLLLTQSITDDTDYAHGGRVSHIAALLSLGTQLENPQDLALAGLFHDLGKMRLPLELQKKDFATMPAAELEVFNTFPEETLKLLQEKRVALPEIVQHYILQQLERCDGQGVPKHLVEDKIEKGTFLLIIANQLDMFLKPGRRQAPPDLATVLKKIESIGGVPIAILNSVKELLLVSE